MWCFVMLFYRRKVSGLVVYVKCYKFDKVKHLVYELLQLYSYRILVVMVTSNSFSYMEIYSLPKDWRRALLDPAYTKA